jgi:hypothetical protein
MFIPFLNEARKNFNGSQRENSKFVFSESSVKVSGYQVYQITKTPVSITFDGHKQKKQVELINKVIFTPGKTLLDFGCSNGLIGINTLLKYSLKNVTLVDHDIQVINNLTSLQKWDPMFTDKIFPVKSSFDKYTAKHDYVLALSIIHWLYSATSDSGCLFKIISSFRNLTNCALIIEWIDPSDAGIKHLHHLDLNKSIQKTPYNKDNFIKALELSFSHFEKLGDSVANTRELYVAYV